MIRPATQADADAMDRMLRGLSAHTGDLDHHEGSAETLRAAGPGGAGLFRALIADGTSGPHGMVLFFPYYSTIRGAAGVYVQDLFVDPNARGTGLGRALLAAAARHAADAWGARFLILSAARDNSGALAFYDRLGLVRNEGEVQLTLEGPPFTELAQGAPA